MTDDFQYYDANEMFHGSMMDIMGTRFDILFFEKKSIIAESLWQDIKTELIHLNHMLNKFDTNSDLSYINQFAYRQTVKPKAELWNILSDCYTFYEKTKGYFDVSKKDMSKVILSETDKTVSFINADISLDLGAYAKGYALHKIHNQLQSANIQHAFINFGNSSICGMGHHPYGDSWKISVENPYKQNEVIHEVVLKNASLSTSGNTTTYSNHIINPIIGKANNEKKLTCVTAKNPVIAEVLSTILMIVPNEDIKSILTEFEIEDFKIFKLI